MKKIKLAGVAFVGRAVCVRTDEAESLIRCWLDADIKTGQLRQKYMPIF